MANETFADVTVINGGGFQPGLEGPQAGMEIHKAEFSVEPEFNNERHNYQGVAAGFVVGPAKMDGSMGGDCIFPLAGVAINDFVTPFVPDISVPSLGGAPIGGGIYIKMLKVDFAAQGGQLATLEATFHSRKNVP